MALLTTSSWFRKNYRNFKGHMNRLRGNCDRFTESDSSDPESLLKVILFMPRLFLLFDYLNYHLYYLKVNSKLMFII